MCFGAPQSCTHHATPWHYHRHHYEDRTFCSHHGDVSEVKKGHGRFESCASINQIQLKRISISILTYNTLAIELCRRKRWRDTSQQRRDRDLPLSARLMENSWGLHSY